MNKREVQIFLLDRDANTLFAMASKLSEAGFDIQSNNIDHDVVYLFNKLKENEPKMIVLDTKDYSDGGYDFLHLIKSSEELAHTHVMVYTDNDDEKNIAKLKNYGVEYFFSKEKFSIDEIIEKISKIYKNKFKINDS